MVTISQEIFAIDVVPPTQNLPSISDSSPGDVIASIISYGIGLTGILAVMAITWAGIQMIVAAGDEEKTKKARSMMIFAFVGVIIAGLAYATVKLITNLNLDSFL